MSESQTAIAKSVTTYAQWPSQFPHMFENASLKRNRAEHDPCVYVGKVEQKFIAPWPAPYSLKTEVTAMASLFSSRQAMK